MNRPPEKFTLALLPGHHETVAWGEREDFAFVLTRIRHDDGKDLFSILSFDITSGIGGRKVYDWSHARVSAHVVTLELGQHILGEWVDGKYSVELHRSYRVLDTRYQVIQ